MWPTGDNPYWRLTLKVSNDTGTLAEETLDINNLAHGALDFNGLLHELEKPAPDQDFGDKRMERLEEKGSLRSLEAE